MSLINDMLNDLDERRSQQQRQETSLDWMSGQRINRKKHWLMPLIIVLAILVLVAFGFAIWRLMQAADMAAVDKLTALHQTAMAKNTQQVQAPVIEEDISGKASGVKNATQQHNDNANSLVENSEENIETAKLNVETDALETRHVETKPIETNASVKHARVESLTPKSISSISKPVKETPTADIKTDRPLTQAQLDIKQARQAEMLIRDGRIAQAEAELQAFLQNYPQAERSAELLASAWLSQQRFDEVETLLASMKAYSTRSVGLQKIEARLLMLTGRSEQAVDLLMAGQPAIERHADYYVLLGLAARQTQRYRLSAETYSGLLAFDASQGDWWVGLAIALDFQEQSTAAREAYRRALEQRKLSPALRSYAEQRLN